jgi:hypothetical protein
MSNWHSLKNANRGHVFRLFFAARSIACARCSDALPRHRGARLGAYASFCLDSLWVKSQN